MNHPRIEAAVWLALLLVFSLFVILLAAHMIGEN